ncbi:MAG TPA: hypothetical protein VND21_03070 [Planctomycetota bacterium]|nr:hypothetical protein [Planctomycetota bacterium]
MIVAAAVLLGIAALGGSALLALRLRGGNPPLLFVRVHGAVAATGLVTLVVGAIAERAFGAPVVAIVAFAFAAGVGLWMAKQHTAGRLVPIGAVFLHVLLVLLGASALLAYFIA